MSEAVQSATTRMAVELLEPPTIPAVNVEHLIREEQIRRAREARRQAIEEHNRRVVRAIADAAVARHLAGDR